MILIALAMCHRGLLHITTSFSFITTLYMYFIEFWSPTYLTDALGNLKAIFPAKSELYLAEKLQCSNGYLQQTVLSILHEQGL